MSTKLIKTTHIITFIALVIYYLLLYFYDKIFITSIIYY